MDINATDALTIIGELTYQKRMLEAELATVREQAAQILLENEALREEMRGGEQLSLTDMLREDENGLATGRHTEGASDGGRAA